MEERTAPEVDVDWLRLTKPNGDAHARVCKTFVDTPTDQGLSGLPASCGLLAVSNRWGLVCVGARSSINIFKLDDILASIESGSSDQATSVTPLHRVNTQGGRPQWVRLAARDRKVVVGLAGGEGSGGGGGGGVWVWSLKDLASAKTAPQHVFREDSPATRELLPNPSMTGALPHLVLALSEKGVTLLDIEKFEVAGRIDGDFTSAAWSVRGKQFVLGHKDGSLEQYAPDGTLKSTISAPPGAGQVTSLAWLENDAFLATYQDAEDDQELKTYLVERSGTATLFDAILPPFGLERANGHRELANVRAWGSTKHLGFLTSPASPDIAILRSGSTNGDAGGWSVVIPDESARASVPLLEATSESSGDDDATCLGLDIDLTSTTPISQAFSGGIEQPDLPPAPRLLEYTSDGIIIVYNIINTQDGAYGEMVQASDILTAPEDFPETASQSSMTPSTSTSSVSTASPFTAQTSSPAAKPMFGFGTGAKLPTVGGGFGQAAGGGFGAKPAFGSSTAFGSGASTPAFGSSSSFGTSSSAAAPASKPAFGSSSAFGSGASTPAFGSSSFGSGVNGSQSTLTQPTTKPAFGSSAFGSSSFGGGASTGTASPAFGSSAFGSSAFGASTPAAQANDNSKEETKSGFGAFAPKGGSSFGSSAFGAGGSKTPSAFGSTSSPAPSLFGAKPAPKVSEPSSGSAFGLGGLEDMLGDESKAGDSEEDEKDSDGGKQAKIQESSASKPASAFIQPSKAGSAFGAFAPKPTTSAFASPSGSTTPSAFAGFGQTNKGPAAPAFGSPSAFGQTSKPATTTPAFGSPSAFGQSASAKFGSSQPSTPSPGPAFGQTSGFGQTSSFGKSPSAFGQTSAFGQAASGITTPISKPASGGFGSFASATPSTSAFSGFASPSGSSIFGKPTTEKPAVEEKKADDTAAPPKSSEEGSDAEGYDVEGSEDEGSFDDQYENESAEESEEAESEVGPSEEESEPEDLGDVTDAGESRGEEDDTSAVASKAEQERSQPETTPTAKPAGDDKDADASTSTEQQSAAADAFKTEHARAPSETPTTTPSPAAETSALKTPFSFGSAAPAPIKKESSTPFSFGGVSSALKSSKQSSPPSDPREGVPSTFDSASTTTEKQKSEVFPSKEPQEDSEAKDAKVASSGEKASETPSTTPIFGQSAKIPSAGAQTSPFSFAKPAESAKDKPSGFSFGTPSAPPTKPLSFQTTTPTPESTESKPAELSPAPKPFSFGATPAATTAPATSKPLFGFGTGAPSQSDSPSPSPPTESAKPADVNAPAPSKPLFGFGTTTAPAPSAPTSKPSTNGFSFGGPPATPSPKPTPPASTTPAGSPQPLFSQPPQPAKPVTAPEPPTPTPPQQVVRPNMASSKPSHPLGQLRMPSTVPARSSPLATGVSVVPDAAASPPTTPASSGKAPPRDPVVTTTPTRRKTELVQEPAVMPGGLAAQAETLYRTMDARLKNLRKTADGAAAYHADIRGAGSGRVTADDLAEASFVPFDQLAVVTDHVAHLRAEAASSSTRAEEKKLESEIRALVADMHSANSKAENCARYIRARSDPDFARRLRVRQLGPEQAEMQQRLRVEVKTARDRLDKIESQLAAMKRRVAYERNGACPSSPLRSSTSSPASPFRASGGSPSSSHRERTLEKAQAAIRAMDLNAQDAQRAIETLTRRVAELNVSQRRRSGVSARSSMGRSGSTAAPSGQIASPGASKRRVKLAFNADEVEDDEDDDLSAGYQQLSGNGPSGSALVAVTELASRALNAELQGAEIRRTLLEARERTRGPLVTKSR